MTDTEERIQKLQKLLDRVLARDDGEGLAETPGEAPTIEEKKHESPAKGAAGEDATAEVEVPYRKQDYAKEVEEVSKSSPPAAAPKEDGEEAAAALESRSRLVSASAPTDRDSQGTLEVTEADLIPDSEAPDAPESAMPLVRKSRGPSSGHERVSEGRISLDDAVPISSRSLIEDVGTLAEEAATEEVASSELVDEAPTSSRRPIAIPEEEYSAPRHTPPPESGKQVAAPSLSGGETTGVRKSAGPPALPASAIPAAQPAAPAPLEPDVLRSTLPEAAKVASIEGTPAVTPRPKTFGELLDLALDL
jgi:hypothetical protein